MKAQHGGQHVAAADARERPEQVLADSLRRAEARARSPWLTWPSADRTPWAWSPIPRAGAWRGRSAASRDTLLSGSLRSPNTIASAGQDCTQAGCTSPSASGRPSCGRVLLGALDPLDAERAFLHHAGRAHGDIGIVLQLERLGPLRREPVEVAHRVGAVVGAVERADAAVVDLDVESFRVVIGRVDRAHRLAGRVVALLAQHRHVLHLHVRELAFVVAVHADPVRGAALGGLLGSRNRQIVFGVASHHAGFAARAAVQIDRHSPTVFHRLLRFTCGRTLSPRGPAPKTGSSPRRPPTRARRTRVAPSTSAPVDFSQTGARIDSGLAPRPEA